MPRMSTAITMDMDCPVSLVILVVDDGEVARDKRVEHLRRRHRVRDARARVATLARLIADKECGARAWLSAALRRASASDQASARRLSTRLRFHPA